jgi:hypothetical protein
MKLQAIIFMCNDFKRLDFTLEGFTKHNPDIPVLVVNSGGNPPNEITDKYSSVTLNNAPNLWHKQNHSGPGSFGPQYYDYLFEYGLNENFTHTIFLETDVQTNGKIVHEPLYDLSGPLGGNGAAEDFLYTYYNIPEPRLHTGCGGTAFSLNYFKTIKEKNYDFFQKAFDKMSRHYFMDMITTFAARRAGLTFGDWDAVSNHEYTHKKIQGNYVRVPCDYTASLVHNIKV